MTATVCHIPGCDNPTPTSNETTIVCDACWNRYRQALTEVPTLIRELDITISRQAVLAVNGGGSRSGETPLAFHQGASDALAELTTTIYAIAECTGIPRHTGHVWAALLAANLRNHPAAHIIVGDVVAAARKAWRIIDRHPDQQPLGKCLADTPDGPCQRELYTPPGRVQVTCQGCGSIWNVDEKKAWLVSLLADTLVTRTEAVSFLALVGIQPAVDKTFTRWKQSGRLLVRGHHGRAEQYRWGDIVDLHLMPVTTVARRS